jgi:hypothetical protein
MIISCFFYESYQKYFGSHPKIASDPAALLDSRCHLVYGIKSPKSEDHVFRPT